MYFDKLNITIPEIKVEKNNKPFDSTDEKYSLTILAENEFKFIPYKIETKLTGETGIYYHVMIDENWDDFFYKEDENGTETYYFKETEFEFRKSNFPSFEIDKWVAEDVDKEKATLFLCDSLKPALGSFSERLIGMHARLTDGMRDEMIGNLNSLYYGVEGSKMDVGDIEGEAGTKAITESLSKPTVRAPPGSSPYALRGEHIRRSLLNRGVDATETIDQVIYPWEQDFALNQAAKWREKIKAMVFSTVAALVTTQVDRRTTKDLFPAEWMIVRKEADEFWKTNAEKTFRMESRAAPLWDSGDKKPKSSPIGETEDFQEQLYSFFKKIEDKFGQFASDLGNDKGEEVQKFTREMFGDANDIGTASNFNMKAAQEHLGIKKKTTLEVVNDIRTFFSNQALQEGIFSFKTIEETQFAENVYDYFDKLTDFEKNTVTLFYKDSIYPHEGFSYDLQTLGFGPSNSAGNSFFSIGHGINLLTEGTEIAASFLQFSDWALTARLIPGKDYTAAKNEIRFYREDVDERKFFDQSFNQNGKKSYRDANPQSTGVPSLADYSVAQAIEKPPKEGYIYYKPRELLYQELACWLADNFLGYCYERPHVVDKPMFAKLVNVNKIRFLCKSALDSGFVKTTESFETDLKNLVDEGDDPKKKNKIKTLYAQSRIFFFMKHESESRSAPKARRMENIVQPYLVSVTSSSVGTGIQSFMHMEDWWGPKPDFFSVEAEGLFILKQMATERFRKKRKFGGAFRYEGTIGEWFSEISGVDSFAEVVKECRNQDSAAAVVVRLVEAVQAANEAVIDGGRTQRDKEGREYVNQARFSYAMQLLEMKKG